MPLPIFYINLAARRDRREFMESQLRAMGMAAVRIEAVTADEAAVSRRQIEAIRAKFSDPEVACNLSHRLAWERIVRSRAPAGVVLEDDAVLGPRFPELLDWDRYASWSPPLVRLETFLRRTRLGTRTLRPAPGFAARTLVSAEAGAAAYIISSEAARLALDDPSSHRLLVDAYLFGTRGPFLHRRKVLQLCPAPVIQAYKLPQLKSSALSGSDLRATREEREVADGAFKPRPGHVWRRRLALARWLIEDPGLLLRRPRVVPYAGAEMAIERPGEG